MPSPIKIWFHYEDISSKAHPLVPSPNALVMGGQENILKTENAYTDEST